MYLKTKSPYYKMETLNYDVFSVIFDFLNIQECYNVSVVNKYVFYNIIKNNGYLKTLVFNKNYPAKKYQDGFDVMKSVIMHRRRVKTIAINFVRDPVHWIPYWSETMIFNRCNLYSINPLRKVNTKYLYIKNDGKEVNINHDKFPYLEKIVLID
jgi:hypothetical protein